MVNRQSSLLRRRDDKKCSTHNLMQKTFGIIGYGRFGKLWAEAIAPFGEVLVYDTVFQNGDNIPKFPPQVRFVQLSEVAKVDVLFLAVPISNFEVVCQEIKPLLSPATIVVDTCAVKVYPAKVMPALLSSDQPLIAAHPLFGPDSVARLGLPGRKIVFCPLRVDASQRSIVFGLFQNLKLNIIETTPDNHDRQMARSQALVHLLGRAFADLNLEDQEISTPDYESLLRIDNLVNNDTWQLFFDMQCYNPYTPLMRLTLRQSLDELEERIRKEGESKAPDDGTFFLWRSMIDQLDHEVINVIAHRLKVGKRVQEYKKLRNLPVTDPDRERELDRSYTEWLEEAGIENIAAVKQILYSIIKEVKS